MKRTYPVILICGLLSAAVIAAAALLLLGAESPGRPAAEQAQASVETAGEAAGKDAEVPAGEAADETVDMAVSATGTVSPAREAADAVIPAETAGAVQSGRSAGKAPAAAQPETSAAAVNTELPSSENASEIKVLSPDDLNSLQYLGTGTVCVDSEGLNLRTAPDTNSDVILTIPNDTKLDLYNADTVGWYAVQYNGKTGYVNFRYINTANTEESQQNPPAPDIAPIAGIWYENQELDPRTLTINSDGSFVLQYRGGGSILGTIKANDNNGEISYIFTDNGGDVWGVMSVSSADGKEVLSDGQLGTLSFFR